MPDQPVTQRVSGDHNVFTATGDVHIHQAPPVLSPAEAREQRELNILLRRVKQFWIEGVLDKAVINIALIDLGKETQAEAVTHAWEQVLELPDQTRQTMPPDKKIGQIFEELNRSLLILGAPGSGKTITLLQLARELIRLAENDETYTQPIPVIFNLSTWTDKQPALFDWLIAELSSKYQIPRANSSAWLKENRLLPLLDGLDEVEPVHRAACVEAINQFETEYGLSGLAVCSRLEEYTSLPVRLRLNGAIRLMPLTLDQVYAALDAAGEKLDGIKKILHIDESLQVLARSPLFLGIMLLTYQGQPPVQEPAADPLARRQKLFAAYVDYMFKRKLAGDKPYADQQTRHWLAGLARQMQQKRQTIFLIEQIQPDWLAASFFRGLYLLVSRLLGGILLGLIVGVFIGINIGLNAGFLGGVVVGLIDIYQALKPAAQGWEEKNKLWSAAIPVVTIGLNVWFVIWLVGALTGAYFEGFLYGLVFGTVFGITFGIGGQHALIDRDIRTVEALSWDWKKAYQYGRLGLLAGIVFGIGAELVYRVSFGFAIIGWVGWWLGTSILVGTAAGLSGLILGGLQSRVIEIKTHPNQGIRLSLRNGVYAGSIAGVIIGLLGVLLGDYFGGLVEALSGNLIRWPGAGWLGGLLCGLTGAMLVGFWYGWFDILKHYTLRFLLFLRGAVPFSLGRFLEYAADRVFLQRVGGGYIFIHRLLLEYFAEMDKK